MGGSASKFLGATGRDWARLAIEAEFFGLERDAGLPADSVRKVQEAEGGRVEGFFEQCGRSRNSCTRIMP